MQKTVISMHLKSHFIRLYRMAVTDGDFSPLELKMLYQFAEDRGVPSDELDRILLSPIGKMGIPETVEERIEYLFDFSRMIWADGIVTEDEIETLKKFCLKFQFKEENVEELSQYLIKSVKDGKGKDEILNELK